MRFVKYIPLCFALSLAGCLDEKKRDTAAASSFRTPVDQLSFDELKRVAEDCQKTGKIATDDYCKEAGYVFAWKGREKREQDRLFRAKKEKYGTKGPWD